MAKQTQPTVKEKRIDQLEDLGFSLNDEFMRYELKDSFFTVAQLDQYSDEEWEKLIAAIPADETPGLELAKTEQTVINVDFAAEMKVMETFKETVILFKRKYGPNKLIIKGVEDKKGLEKNQEAARDMLKKRQEIEDYIEGKIRPHLDTVTWYKTNLGTLVKLIKELQDSAKEKRDKHKELVLSEKNKETERIANLVKDRVPLLIEAGMAFDGQFYSIGNEEFGVPVTSYGVADIQTMTEAVWEDHLAVIKQKNATITQKQIEKEAETERLRLEKEKQDNQNKADLEEAKKELVATRGELLLGIGMEETETAFIYGDKSVTKEVVGTSNYATWTPIYAALKSEIATIKETARKAEEEKQMLADRQKELLDLKMVWNAGKQEFALNGVYINIHFIKTATPGGWEECIADTKEKIEAAAILAKLKDDRHYELLSFDMEENLKFEGYSYKGLGIDVSQHLSKDDNEQWNFYITNTVKPAIEKVNADHLLQKERNAKIAPFLLFGHAIDLKNLYKLEQSEWEKLLSETEQAHKDKIAKDANDEIARQNKIKADNLAKGTDKEKWQHFLNSLPTVSEMESEDYIKLAGKGTQLINQIKALS